MWICEYSEIEGSTDVSLARNDCFHALFYPFVIVNITGLQISLLPDYKKNILREIQISARTVGNCSTSPFKGVILVAAKGVIT